MGQSGEVFQKQREMRKTQSTILEAGGPGPLNCYNMEGEGGVHMGPGPTEAPTHKATRWLRLLHHRGLAISLTTPASTVAPVYSSPRSINLSPTQEQPEREATAG